MSKMWFPSFSIPQRFKLGEKKSGEAGPSEPSEPSAPISLTYEQLASATNNFDSLIREGGSGGVYSGILNLKPKLRELRIAVKNISLDTLGGENVFFDKMVDLSSYNHPNIIKMLGYCFEENHCMIVYKLMPLGSLYQQLHKDLAPGEEGIDLDSRIKIAVGVAKAIEYLHTRGEPVVISKDMKSSNVLLEEGYEPLISDIGFGSNDQTLEMLSGEPITTKSDVYMFGVLLLELITGQKVVDESVSLVAKVRQELDDRSKVRQYSHLVDPKMGPAFSMTKLVLLVDKALQCVSPEVDERPTMADILNSLENELEEMSTSDEVRAHLLTRFSSGTS